MKHTPEPFPLGTIYDNQRIVEVCDYDPTDEGLPFLYALENGLTVWIAPDDPEVTLPDGLSKRK